MNLLETSFVLGQRMVFSNVLIERFVEGGLSGMTLILLCLLLAAYFTYKALTNLNGEHTKFLKYIKLINQVVLLGLVISFADSLMGLIQGFDALEASGGEEPAIIAAGLKITLLSPLFGLIVFILGHISTFVLSWMRKEESKLTL